MRYQRTPLGIYIMLVVMGIGFMGGAFAFYLFVPQPAGTIVGVVWLLMGGGMAFFSMRAIAGRRNDERIAREGTAATATLLGAATTGLLINNVPQWKLRLRIDGAGASYETDLKLTTYNPPPNGARMGVRIDPANRAHVVLSDDAPADAPSDGSSSSLSTGGSTSAIGNDVAASIAAALRQAGFNPGTTIVTSSDGTRTLDASSVHTTIGAPDAAETVRLLAELERMHATGTLGDAEFDALKRKLLGEADPT